MSEAAGIYVMTPTGLSEAATVPGPKGDKGDKGDTGDVGPQGAAGVLILNPGDPVPAGTAVDTIIFRRV